MTKNIIHHPNVLCEYKYIKHPNKKNAEVTSYEHCFTNDIIIALTTILVSVCDVVVTMSRAYRR